MKFPDLNISIAAFYRSGILSMRQLLNVGYDRDDIRVLTHDLDRNEEFIAFLKEEDITYTTDSIQDESTQRWLLSFDPDVLFSLYYREKIPKSVLDAHQYGGVNIHPSLLPKYRGVLAVPWAMWNGDEHTGFTYHYMTEEFDAGRIVLQEQLPIIPRDTAYSLYHRIIHAGMDRFLDVFDLVVNQEYKGEEQTGESCYHERDELPNDGYINPSWDEERVDRFIKAMYYPPFDPAKIKLDGEEFEVVSLTEFRQLMQHHRSTTRI